MSTHLMSASGFLFDFCAITVDDIDIHAIANSLAKQCRFHGNCSAFYSVAQHSILLSSMVPKEYKKWALMHDAAEAYISDLAAPIKLLLPKYIEIEENVLKIIAKKFELDYPIPQEVLYADLILRKTEMLNLFPIGTAWSDAVDFSDAQDFKIIPYANWEEAARKFMSRFKELFNVTDNELSKYEVVR